MTYPGDEDHISHFYKYLNAFKDKRYIKVDGKLLFVIFAPQDFVDFPHFKDLWNKLAEKEGLKGFHFVGLTENFRLHTSDGKIRNVFSPKDASGDYYTIFYR